MSDIDEKLKEWVEAHERNGYAGDNERDFVSDTLALCALQHEALEDWDMYRDEGSDTKLHEALRAAKEFQEKYQ